MGIYDKVYSYMIQEKTKEKVKILAFWDKYGAEATEEVFKKSLQTLI